MASDTGLGPAGACDAKTVWAMGGLGPAHSTEGGRTASAGMEMAAGAQATEGSASYHWASQILRC